MRIKKENIKEKIEPFVYERLSRDYYEISTCPARKLLTWNRFDLGFKLFYLENIDRAPEISKLVYKEDIRVQTQGTYVEYGNNSKNSFSKYEEDFLSIKSAISSEGFDSEKSLLPLSLDGSIVNGAHRLACSIITGAEVDCFRTEQNTMLCTYEYFYNNNVPEFILDIAANTFIEYSENVYIAFLWPSGSRNLSMSEALFDSVVYKKKMDLTATGAFNLLVELYKHMDWVGSPLKSYPGIKQKMLECFSEKGEVSVIVFQSESIDNVRLIKQKVRDINGIGFSSIHITDDCEEAIRISRLIFSKNGLHFINNANPFRYSAAEEIDNFARVMEVNGFSFKDFALDGSVLLSLYGIRKHADIDYIAISGIELPKPYEKRSAEQMCFHEFAAEDLLYDPRNFFYFRGVKLISFERAYQAKKKRNEAKDIADLRSMSAMVGRGNFRIVLARLRQYLFYTKLRVSRNSRKAMLSIIRISGMYRPLRYIYRLIKGGSK